MRCGHIITSSKLSTIVAVLVVYSLFFGVTDHLFFEKSDQMFIIESIFLFLSILGFKQVPMLKHTLTKQFYFQTK